MLMHLYLLKEQDWSHFVALAVVAGSVEQGCFHPLLLNPVPPGIELQGGCLAVSHSQFTELSLLVWVLRLAFHSVNLALVWELELVEVRVHFDDTQKNQQSQVCKEKWYLLLAPVIGLADRYECGHTANAHIWWRGKSLPAKCRLRAIALSLTWLINWTIWERRWWAHLGWESEEMEGLLAPMRKRLSNLFW